MFCIKELQIVFRLPMLALATEKWKSVNTKFNIKFHVTVRNRKLRMQRFYLTFCDILHVTHLHYLFFNNVPIKLTKTLDRYLHCKNKC